MIAPQPPHTIEVLLASLGAETDFRDAVIGDLAEEFSQRAERDGVRAARRWYQLEAARATPHLLVNWIRHLRLAGLMHIAGSLATTYAIVMITFLLVGASVASIVAAVSGTPLVAQRLPWENPVAAVLMLLALLVIDAAVGLFGGYVAAYLNPRAPLAAAFTLGSAWGALAIVSQTIQGVPPIFRHLPPGLNVLPIAITLASTVVGGALRVRSANSNPDGDRQIA